MDPAGKTDQAGQGAEVGLPRGRHVETCPVCAFEAWQAVARRKAAPLFRKISIGDGIGDTALIAVMVFTGLGGGGYRSDQPTKSRQELLGPL